MLSRTAEALTRAYFTRAPVALGLAVLLAAWAGAAHAASCEQLATSLHLPATTLAIAETVAAGAFKPTGGGLPPGTPPGPSPYASLPAFCRVAGTIKPTPDSDIRFEVWMPASGWNGKFVGVGNGVWAGSISFFEMTRPLMRGYATAATDDGHQGSPLDAGFAAGHPEKLIDFGHRAVHEMTRVAKATVAAYYGKPASRSLFASCSTGGRQGLMEAYRYPRDYDAISSMAPANPMVDLMVSSLWTGYAALKDPASHIPPPKLALVHKAAVAACDEIDGVKDGIISAPERCHFDPAVLTCKGEETADCLTGPQVEALRAIYQGPMDPTAGKQIFAGFEPGSEALFPLQTAGPEPFGAAASFMRSLVFKDPKWDFRSFDYGRDVERARQAASDAIDVPPTGLDQFFAGGGKLLLSHGWADGLIPSRNTVELYKAMATRLGSRKADKAVRLFMVPGMSHCSGGDGPYVIDVLSAIDSWARTGHPPERIIASNPPSATPRTRPLCPYPLEAAYQGSGSFDDEQSFRCGTPGGSP
jgi:hypothetical protein